MRMIIPHLGVSCERFSEESVRKDGLRTDSSQGVGDSEDFSQKESDRANITIPPTDHRYQGIQAIVTCKIRNYHYFVV